MFHRSLSAFSTILAMVLFVSSCSSTRPEGKTEAEVLYKEAQQMVEKSRFIMATEKLNQIRSQFPYSYYATPAELLQADILYEQGNYVEAAASYLLFKDFHPRHEKIDYVTFKIAESYYEQLPSTYDRDLNSGIEAMNFYRDLLRNHSNSKYVEGAVSKIKKIEGMIRNREKYVADFYFKTHVYDSARFRYLKILEEFEDQDLREHSMTRIMLSSLELGEKDKCEQFYRDFSSELEKKTYKKAFNSAYNKCKKL